MKLLIFILTLILPCLAIAVPSAPTIVNNGSFTGTGFGTKSIAAPIRFSNNESESIGALPTGYTKANYSGTQVGISSATAHSGTKSVNFDFGGMVYSGTGGGAERFPRIAADMGAGTNVDNVYVSAWVRMDGTTLDTSPFNWKGPLLSSATNYYWSGGPNTASGFAGFHYGTPTMYWRGGASATQYSSNGSDAQFSYGSNSSWPSDSFLFGQWQRIEWIWKSSSAASVADGTITVNRLGRTTPQLFKDTGIITHGPSDNRWRYVSIPQGITNVSATLDMQMYFDDIYIDNSLARAELCDTATWPSRTHCEIQPPTSWSDTSITTTYNPGSFATGSTAYFYVIDSTGAVSPASDGFTVTDGGTPTVSATSSKASGRYSFR